MKFLTKAEREQLALHRRQHEALESHNRRLLSSDPVQNHHHHRDRKEQEGNNVARSAKREHDKDLEAIKEQYLGCNKSKKRVIVKPSDKFRFCFDWDKTDDTSSSSRTRATHEAQLLFGRGFRGGMDRREQKKNVANDHMRVDRHWSDKSLDEMTERDWRIFREDYNISYKGGGSRIPKPIRRWGESGLSPELLRAVERAGYKEPSPIQMAAIPLGLQQRDVIGIAQTGSGKTAAFVIPMLDYVSRLPRISEDNEAEGPYAVVMAPTRELAQQIEQETVRFAHYLGIRVVSIVGGQSIEEQGFKIRQGCEVVIATPGRLIDCLERRLLVFWKQCRPAISSHRMRMRSLITERSTEPLICSVPPCLLPWSVFRIST